MTTTRTATAHHVTITRLAGQLHIADDNTGNKIGYADLIHGFAHYTGARGTAHEGITAVVRGGAEGLTRALDTGLTSGRDDRH